MRAVWVMGGALLFLMLSALLDLPELGRLNYDAAIGLASLSYSLTLGVCVYLMIQGAAKYKAISGAGLLLGSVLRAFSVTFINMYANTMSAPPIGAVLR